MIGIGPEQIAQERNAASRSRIRKARDDDDVFVTA